MAVNQATRIIYIHGFNSSPQSYKATAFGEYLKQFNQVEYLVPTLNHEPLACIYRLEQLLTPTTRLIGSSLGGYFATYLSQQYQLPAVVINPAVAPYELMADFLGPQYNPYQDYHYEVTRAHVEQLKALSVEKLKTPSLVHLYQQTGDEVLDFSKAVQYYKQCSQTIEFAGDHSFQQVERHFPDIVSFFKIT